VDLEGWREALRPGLSPAGHERAELLAEHLAHAKVEAIVTGLSGVPILALCDTSFSRVFVVNPGNSSVASLHYGAADPAPADGCQ